MSRPRVPARRRCRPSGERRWVLVTWEPPGSMGRPGARLIAHGCRRGAAPRWFSTSVRQSRPAPTIVEWPGPVSTQAPDQLKAADEREVTEGERHGSFSSAKVTRKSLAQIVAGTFGTDK